MSAIEAAEGFDIMRLERDQVTAKRRKRIFRAALGSTLVLVGTLPLGRLRGLMLALGAGILTREVIQELRHASWPALPLPKSAARIKHERLDTVDEASWQSFPASDPPSY